MTSPSRKRPPKPQAQAAHAQRLAAQQLDELLPQIQCGQCGYGGCLPYAQAMASGSTPVNLCTPGGSRTTQALADKLSRKDIQIDPATDSFSSQVVQIDEARCVGCYKCIEACPVDAIIGAHGMLHTVLAGTCTDCGLCIDVCPVDCIERVEAPAAAGDGMLVRGGIAGLPQAAAAAARLKSRYQAKLERPPLRGPATTGSLTPEQLATRAMNNARKRRRQG